MSARAICLAGFVLALGSTGCGAPSSSDQRGYTKAPLEQPGVFVKTPPPDPMRSLGDHPILPDTARIVLPDSILNPTKKAS